MEIDYKKLGSRIQEVRKREKISQEDLAFKAGITPPYLSQIENGKKKVSLPVLSEIADTLKISLDELVSGTFRISGYLADFDLLLRDGNDYERRIMFELSASIKRILRENRDLLVL